MVNSAKAGTNSVRATIPEGIASFLELSEGDLLDWSMDFEDGVKVVKVKRIKGEKPAKSLDTPARKPTVFEKVKKLSEKREEMSRNGL